MAILIDAKATDREMIGFTVKFDHLSDARDALTSGKMLDLRLPQEMVPLFEDQETGLFLVNMIKSAAAEYLGIGETAH